MTKSEINPASRNVFADLGVDEPEEYLQKVDLAIRINDIIGDRKLTQSKAAQILGIDQPKISLLKRGLLDAFSIERLMKLLRILGDEHEIRPKRRQTLQAGNVGAHQTPYYSNMAAQNEP